MLAYALRRLLQFAIVILGVTVLAFGALFLTGDPTALIVGQTNWTVAQLAEFRHQMGFDRPWLVQYGDFMWGLVRGSLGNSLHYNEPVAALIRERLPYTLSLAVCAIAGALVVALPVGVLSALKRNSLLDTVSRIFALLGQAMPVFWLGEMMIIIFAVGLRWFPASGSGTWASLVLPAGTLALYSMGRTMRMIRSSLLEVLHQDFIRTARAKGLFELSVVVKHGLRNALIPVVTLFGLETGVLLGGAVVTEYVFSWPGLGRLVLESISTKDFPVVEGGVILFAVIFAGVNLAVDLSYAFLDPRIRYS